MASRMKINRTHSRAENERAPQTAPSTLAPQQQVDMNAVQRAMADPASASPQDFLALQQVVGNRTATQMLGRGGDSKRPTIQAKLTVGPAGDSYEQEADRVANQVAGSMSQPVQRQGEEEEIQTKPLDIQRGPMDEEEVQTKALDIQRGPMDEEEVQTKALDIQRGPMDEEEVQTKPLDIQRGPMDEEEVQAKALDIQRGPMDEEEVQTKALDIQRGPMDEEEVQTKALDIQRGPMDEEEVQTKALDIQRGPMDEEEVQTKRSAGDGFDASPELEDRLAANKGSGGPLPDSFRGNMEHQLGVDFSGVRVHTGGESVQMNRDLQAAAFTRGQDIYLGEGRYNPASTDGQKLLAHELTHVVQQNTGLQRKKQPETE
jgi:hypothetical protein